MEENRRVVMPSKRPRCGSRAASPLAQLPRNGPAPSTISYSTQTSSSVAKSPNSPFAAFREPLARSQRRRV
jgi:hypothetical protein